MSIRPWLLACCASLIFTASAGAVVGGEQIAFSDAPWFASIASCGGTLVAPDRVLTAAHCFNGMSAADVTALTVAGRTVGVSNIALAPGFEHRNGSANYLNDVAIVQLAEPVTGVTPVALGGTDVREARIIGTGRQYAPGTGHSEAEMLAPTGLRQATLKSLSDADCSKAFKGYKAAAGETYDSARMRCSIDVDGRAPLSSGCNGDSGGPLIAGPGTVAPTGSEGRPDGGNAAPVQLGVVSWGGDRCGADHLASVFTDVARYRDFVLNPSPTWMPKGKLTARVKGNRKKLTCSYSGRREPGTRVRYAWKRLPRWGAPVEVGTGKTYKPTSKDSRVACFVYVASAGGEINAGTVAVAP